MDPGIYDITIYQGATYKRTIELKNQDGTNFDITGFTARMKIRPTPESSQVYLGLTEGAGLTTDTANSKITLTISSTQTAALNFSTAYYDIEIFDGSSPANVDRVLMGKVTLSKEVTR